MSYFEWSDQFDVGVDAMNGEHKQLLAAMQLLHDRAEAGARKTELLRLIDALATVTREHFAHEEAYMDSIDAPNQRSHRTIHKQLLEKLRDHRDEFAAGDEPLGQLFFTFLKLWLSAHIKGIDRKYGEHRRVRAA